MALILTRHEGETIVIGEGASRVEVKVAVVRGDSVRLGITADKSVRVLRGELVGRDAAKKYAGEATDGR